MLAFYTRFACTAISLLFSFHLFSQNTSSGMRGTVSTATGELSEKLSVQVIHLPNGFIPWQYDPLLSRIQGLLALRYTW